MQTVCREREVAHLEERATVMALTPRSQWLGRGLERSLLRPKGKGVANWDIFGMRLTHQAHLVLVEERPHQERATLRLPKVGCIDQVDAHLVYPGDAHWDGIEFPYECAVCGCGGTLGTNPQTGRPMLVIDPESGHIRDRCIDKARAEHLNEIIKTRIDFFQHQDEVKPLMKKYRDMKFPTFTIER